MKNEKLETGTNSEGVNLSIKHEATIAEQLRDLADQIEKLETPPFGYGICFVWLNKDKQHYTTSGFAPFDPHWIDVILRFFESYLRTILGTVGLPGDKQNMN